MNTMFLNLKNKVVSEMQTLYHLENETNTVA